MDWTAAAWRIGKLSREWTTFRGVATVWLPGSHVRDLRATKGNGPWANGPRNGLVLHVNVSESGTPISFFAAGPPTNPNYVCPNWQIYKSPAAGGSWSLLPFNWQSWCQADGNSWGPAVEMAGMPGEPMTQFQLDEAARIYKIGHDEYGWPYQVTDSIYKKGHGTHVMGGLAWGGHSCPGSIRAGQRQTILDIAEGVDMALTDADAELVARKVLTLDGVIKAPEGAGGAPTNPYWSLKSHIEYITKTVQGIGQNGATDAELAKLKAAIDALATGGGTVNLPVTGGNVSIDYGGPTT
jgi:hypothetical protein